MLWEMLKKHPWAIGISVLGHVIVIAVLIISLDSRPKPLYVESGAEPIKAVVVDEKKIDEEAQKLKALAEKKKTEALAKEKKEQEALRKLQAEREKEEARLKQAEQERAALEKKREEEAARLAEIEKQRKAEAEKRAREQQEAEAKRQEEEKRLAAEKAKQEAEAKRKKEEEAARKAAERQRIAELEAERAREEARVRELAEKRASETSRQEARRLEGLNAQYETAIKQKIQRNWIKPPGVPSGIKCEVSVIQLPTGDVIAVSVESCTGGGESLRRSVENAVRKSDPLPQAPDPKLFQRQIQITFSADS